MKQTRIAAAITAVIAVSMFSEVASAASFEELDQKTDWTYTNGDSFPSGGIIQSQKETLAEGESLFLNATDEGSDGYGSQNGFSPTASNATNNGIIYVKGNDTQNTSVIGLSAGYIQGFTATNNGEIWVDGGTSAQSSAIAVTPDNKAVNNGEIHVKNGYGILHLPEEYDENPTKTIAIENNGTIAVEGEGSYAIYSNAQQATESGSFEGAQKHVTVTNTGNIVSSEGAAAIHVGGLNSELILKDASRVEGIVSLGEQTDLTVAINEQGNDKVELVAEKGFGALNLSNGLEFTGKQEHYSAASLNTGDKATLKLTGKRSFEAADFNGKSLDVISDHVTDSDTPILALKGVDKGENVNVKINGYTADTVGSAAEAKALFDKNISINDGTGSYTGELAETAVSGPITIGPDGQISMATSSITESTLEMASLNAMMWRSSLTSLTDRMGLLRSAPNQVGVWTAYRGGELEKDNSNSELNFDTIEMGMDFHLGATPWVAGVALSYSNGDGDFDAGTTEHHNYNLGLYASYFSESGTFIDIMAKVGKMDSDFDFSTRDAVISDSGSLDQMAYAVGVEAGHRFTWNNFFVEPQAQLTYTYLEGDNDTTVNREVDLDASDSLIGRVGTMFGANMWDNRIGVYGRVSVLHDFLGDIEGKVRSTQVADAQWKDFSDELDGTWCEYGVGTTVNFSENASGFVDVSRADGGEVETTWRVNAGLKYLF